MAQAKCVFFYLLDVPAPFRCRPHSHPCTEIVFSRRCAGRLHQQRRVSPFSDESVFIYQPGNEHWIENDQPGRQTCIGVIGSSAASLPPGVLPHAGALDVLFDDFERTAHARPLEFDEELDLLAGLIVVRLRRMLGQNDRPRSPAQQAREVLEKNLAHPLKLAELARRVYVSPDYLRQLFRAEYGSSIMSYYLRARLKLACQLLANSDKTVADIAEACGFTSPYYFSRLFRREMGVAPTAWRSRQRGPT